MLGGWIKPCLVAQEAQGRLKVAPKSILDRAQPLKAPIQPLSLRPTCVPRIPPTHLYKDILPMYTSSLILSNHTFTGHNKVQHNTTEKQVKLHHANKTKEHNTIVQTVHNESSHPNVKSPTYMCAQTPKPSPSLRAILMRDFTDTVMINLFQTQSIFFQTSSYHMCKKLQTSDITISSPLLSLSLAFLSDSLYCISRAGMQKTNEL